MSSYLPMPGSAASAVDTWLLDTVKDIHASPSQAVIIAAGGASQALGWLLSAPGCSNTVLEALVPYSRGSMIDLLGKEPAQYASRLTAREMAAAAYNRALRLCPAGIPVIGLGCTCSLASTTPKRGHHRCFVATRTQDSLHELGLTLAKGRRTRMEEDVVTSRLLILELARASAVGKKVSMHDDGDTMEEFQEVLETDGALQELLEGKVPRVTFSAGKAWGPGRRVVLSGSFNPLHEGHLALLEAATKMVEGGVPCFEMSAVNADKPALEVGVIRRRLEQFELRGQLAVVTAQPYFFKKAEILPDSTFVIGYDTAIRLIDPKYYDGSREKMEEVLRGIHYKGCDFLVAGRLVDGTFGVLEEVQMPPELAGMFRPIPEAVFRMDISSTMLREERAAGSPSGGV